MNTVPATPVWFSPETAEPSNANSSGRITPGPIVAAYYPDWTASQLPPEMVDFTRLDWVDLAFAVPDPMTFTPKFSDADTGALLQRLVTAAHAKNKYAKLSIGGWTGSAHFSDAVNDQNRNKFAGDIVALYHQYDLDGIDIDWEYPGEPGAAGNIYTPSDTANFLAFLQLLRSLLPERARISAATQVWPFMDADGSHSKDISAFAKVLDWVLLMNYDVWSSSPQPGPNAPLSDACHNSTQPEANANAAIASWTAAGFPAQQIMLGLPAYGYVSRSSATSLRARRSLSNLITSPSDTALNNGTVTISPTTPAANVAVLSEAGSADSGQVQFNALITQGALVKNAQGLFVGNGGFQREWDACSSTPFLRSETMQQIVTYDDPESLAMKAGLVKKMGILGVNMWDAHGDTREWDLIDGIRRGLEK
ncbi:glycoside hydrolase family 18 protein [Ramaria rubella]|nr:glycoside hydrolase family 18 protein [Ramaria rubella]